MLHGPPHPPKAIEFIGNRLKDLPIDEIQMARLFQQLLDTQKPTFIEGITLSNTSFFQVAERLAQDGALFHLKEGGISFQEHLTDNFKEISVQHSLNFILSDSVDLEDYEEDHLVQKLSAIPISLGAQSYLASHCIQFLLLQLKKCELF